MSRWRPAPTPRSPRLTRRAAILFALQGGVMGALAWLMRKLQVDDAQRYRLLAEENRINIRLIPPARGQIFDRRGQPLAVNRQNYRVTLVREQAGDVEAVLDRLGRLIEIPEHDRERILREMTRKPAFVPIPVAEHLSWEDFARVNANAPALPGIDVEVGQTRFYPHGPALAHTVGYVGRVNERELEADGGQTPLLQIPDFQIGKTGVETRAEEALRGSAGLSRIEVNARGRKVRELSREEGQPGLDLQLTIDLDLQRYVMERLGGESASVAVIEIATGDVLSSASSPGFEPNQFVFGISSKNWSALLNDPYRPLSNKTVAGVYPPGSTYKMIVALAALEKGVIDGAESVFCNGRYQLGESYFHCGRRGGHGHLGLREALSQSCDVYFYEIARRVGIDAISDMARRLGVGVRPELPVPAVSEGLAPTKDWKRASYDQSWQVGDTLNAGIGQGYVLASPMQLAVMTARIASGRAVAPRLIRGQGGRPLPDPEAPALEVNATHLRMVREGMWSVMNGARGTARKSRIYADGVEFAGKTGTSQVRRITAAERAAGVFRNEDLPWNRRDHALFVGYAPYDAPRYAVATVVEHGGGGSSTAAPIARDVIMRALWNGEPPLSAYPPGEREAEMERRIRPPPPPPPAWGPPGPPPPRGGPPGGGPGGLPGGAGPGPPPRPPFAGP
ncbi:MAG: penicillin-binding protein 2, partial [Albimonas sp.]|uniref:penicillin-binding protein 2 n=1 Tax=Albimonas sp. TaxID=1872425 RepID=UPI0040561443